MDSAAVTRIRQSFELVAPQADRLLDAFYSRLFTVAPAVRAMFPADMSSQKKHLGAAIGLVVKHADRLDEITPALEEMGARHVGYGAQPAHYEVVRETLLGVLEDFAGDAWTTQLERDWTDALNAVAQVMLRGAENATTRQAA